MFRKHEIREENNQLFITLYLDTQNVEFARELNGDNPEVQEDLEKSASRYVKSRFPNIKNATVKIMAGSVLVASLAFGATAASPMAAEAATPVVEFKDIEKTYFEEPVEVLIDKGVVEGYGDDAFIPKRDVTRAEAAAMLARALGLDTNIEPDGAVFKDVTGEWYYGPVAALKAEGVLDGYKDGTFKPNQTVTRAELAKMIVSAYENLEEKPDAKLGFTDVGDDAWYKPYISSIADASITTGRSDTKFAPNANTTRAEAATFIYRSINVDKFGVADGRVPIEAVTDTTVTVNGKDFPLSDEVKGLLKGENSDALKGAVIYANTDKDDVVKELRFLNVTESGTEAEAAIIDGGNVAINGPAMIGGDFLEVNNLTIEKDLTISDATDNLLLNNVVVIGDTVLEEGGAFSAAAADGAATGKISIVESNLGNFAVNKENIEIEVKGSTFGKIELNKNATIAVDEASTISDFIVNEGASEVQVNGMVGKLEIKSSKPISLKGNATIGNLVVPKGTEAKNVISNFDDVKKNIQKINDTDNPDAETVDPDPVVDNTPSADNSTVTTEVVGDNAVKVTMTVKNAAGEGITGLSGNDFKVNLRGESYVVGTTPTFTDFNEVGDGVYEVTFSPGFAINETVDIVANDVEIATGYDIVTAEKIVTVVNSESNIQDVIDAAEENSTIQFEAGTYELSKQLQITKPLNIIGSGDVIIKAAEEFDTGTYSPDENLISIVNTSDVTIENVTITNSKRSGINIFESANVHLKDVISRDNTAAGVVVTNSVVTADNLMTNGNGWYGVNVDNGSSPSEGAPKSSFTLTSGTLAEAVPIMTDKGNVTVNAPEGFTEVHVDGSDKIIWTDKGFAEGSILIAQDDGTATLYSSLQAAVDSAAEGDMITIESGTISLSEQLQINKPVHIVGLGEVTITTTDDYNEGTYNADKNLISVVNTDGVTIENITVTNSKRSGINIFESINVHLKDVVLKDNAAAGLVVTNSVVTAENFTTSGNTWYGVNVDNGSAPSEGAPATIFTLTSGTIGEDYQIVSDKGEVTVNVPDDYQLIEADGKQLWTNKDITQPEA